MSPMIYSEVRNDQIKVGDLLANHATVTVHRVGPATVTWGADEYDLAVGDVFIGCGSSLAITRCDADKTHVVGRPAASPEQPERDEQLPPFVYRTPTGATLVPARHAELEGPPGGWEWVPGEPGGPVGRPVRPIPAPAVPEPERVPVDLALIGRKLPTGETITQFTARPAAELDEASAPGGIYVEVFLNDSVWANVDRAPDGLVAVLPHPENGGER